MAQDKFGDVLTHISEIKSLFEITTKQLQIIELDQKLLKDGIKIDLVVDFDIIHRLAFAHEILEGISEKKIIPESSKQAARAFLFYGLKRVENPVITPSHYTELLNYLKNLKECITPIAFSEREYLRAELYNRLSEEDLKLINEALGQYKEKKKLSKRLSDEVIKIIKGKFLGLYFILSAPEYKESFKVINQLFMKKNRRLHYAKERWPQYQKEISIISKISPRRSKYFTKFEEIRKPEGSQKSSRFYENLIDGRSLDLIEKMNEKYNLPQAGINPRVILMVSDAPSMKKILNHNHLNSDIPKATLKLSNGDKINVSLLRTSNTFFLYLLFRGENLDETLNNIHTRRELFDQLASQQKVIESMYNFIKESCDGRCDNCSKKENCVELIKQIIELKTKVRTNYSLKMGEYHEQILKPYSKINWNSVEPKLKGVLEFFLEDRGFEIELNKEAFRLFIDLSNTVSNIVTESGEIAETKIYYNMANDIWKIIEVYNLRFNNKTTIETLRKFKYYADNNNDDKLSTYFDKITNISQDNKNRDHALVRVILYIVNNCESAVENYVDNEIKMMKDESRIEELKLMEAKALRKLIKGSSENDSRMYKKIISIFKTYDRSMNKPRWINIYATAIFTAIQKDIESEMGYDKPLELFKKSHKLWKTYGEKPESNYFEYYLLNNIAYTYYTKLRETEVTMAEKEKIKTLKKAFEALNKIDRKKVEELYEYEIMGTIAELYLEKIFINFKAKNHVKKQWANTSLNYLNKAKKFAEGRADTQFIQNLSNLISKATRLIDRLEGK